MRKQQSISLAALFCISSLIHAEESQDLLYEKAQKKEEREAREKEYFEKKITTLENTYIPALRNGINIWVHADLIYMAPKISSISYTNETSEIPFTSDFTQKPLVRSDFDWAPGYQVGLGYRFKKTRWDLTFDATHLHSRAHGKQSANDNLLEGMFPVWSLSDQIIAGDYVTEATFSGKLLYDGFHFSAGYFWTVGSRFVFKTSLGLQNIWLKQQYNIKYSGGIFTGGTDYIKMKNNYWGLGPRFQINPWYLLGRGWNLYGKAAVSYFIGIFSIYQKETYLEDELYKNQQHLNRGRWATDFEGGIQWNHLFYHNRFSFSMRLGWEYQIFFDQNEFKKDQFHMLPRDGNVQIQGGVLSLILDF